MELSLRLYGDHGMETYVRGVGRRGLDLKPVMREVGDEMLEANKRLFDRKGQTDHDPPWRPLEGSTLLRKASISPYTTSPLIRTRGLLLSLTNRASPYNLYNATRTSVYVGSTHPTVHLHQEGWIAGTQNPRFVAPRDPIRIATTDKNQYIRMIQDYLFHGRLRRPHA